MDVTFDFTADGDKIEFPDSSLTFNMANWETSQDIAVRGLEDDDATDEMVDVTVTITSDDNAYASLTAPTLTVNVTDNDTRGVVFASSSLTVTELAPSTDSGAITLAAQPLSGMDVTVTFTETSNKIDVFPLSLIFTMDNWDTAQFIAVQGLADADATNEVVQITTSTTSSDSAYDGLTGPTLTVNVTDNDTREVLISESELTVIEGGDASESSKQYTVRLATQPTSQVLVTLGGHEGPDFTASASPSVGGLMIFTTDNWGSDVTVTVTVTNDLIDEDSEMSDITHAVRGGDYGAVTALPVSVTVEDNDTAAVIVTAVSTIAREDGDRRRKLYRQARLTANGHRHNYARHRNKCGRDAPTRRPSCSVRQTGKPPRLSPSWPSMMISMMTVNQSRSRTVATSADPKYDSSLSIEHRNGR